MEQGPHEKKILEDCARFGMPIPEKIRNAPTLRMGLELFYLGFLDLTSCRSVGMGAGPIPLITILEYCIIHGIEGEQQEDFLWFVQRMDSAYLDWSKNRNGSKSG